MRGHGGSGGNQTSAAQPLHDRAARHGRVNWTVGQIESIADHSTRVPFIGEESTPECAMRLGIWPGSTIDKVAHVNGIVIASFLTGTSPASPRRRKKLRD